MKLYYTGNSPSARRPRMAVIEYGLSDKVDVEDCAPLGAADHVLRNHGPGGKVPGLLTDNGVFICETLIILNCLDGLSEGKLYPVSGKAREEAMALEGLAGLLMESQFYRARENRREEGERSPGYLESEATRSQRCYDALESQATGFGDDVNMAHLSVVACLGYADWRHPGDWRDDRPALTAWFDKMMARPSCTETKPVF